jgi:hypothetical protein
MIIRIAAIISLIFSSSIYANENLSILEETIENINPLEIWKFTPGIGARSISLDVTRKSDGYKGEITNDDNLRDGNITELLYFTMNIESPSWMFSSRNGISIRSQTQRINLHRQRVISPAFEEGQDFIDLGTSVEGYYTYIGPTLFAKLENINISGITERIGAGFGYWKASINGDIVLAPNYEASTTIPSTNINDAIDNTIGPIAYYQWLGKNFLFEFSISSVTFKNNQYKSKLEEVNILLGVTF